MSTRIKNFPDGKYLKCAACKHVSDSGVSIFSSEDTPQDKIYIQIGTRYASMYCSDPNCRCYTIYATSSAQVEALTEKYKSK
jgi:hypothetical protein